MNNIRLLNVLILSILLFLSCSSNNGGDKGQTAKADSSKIISENLGNQPPKDTLSQVFNKPEKINTKQFAERVFDFKNNREWKYLGNEPCVIDFYADWCRPCKILAPVIEELAMENAGKIRFYKINTDFEQELAAYFGINSIPSLMFCPMKGKPEMYSGVMPKEDIKKIMGRLFAGQI